MSKLGRSSTLGSDYIRKSKVSLSSKKSKLSGSNVSEHGSMFGRSVGKYSQKNNSGLVRTLSIINSRTIHTNFNPTLQLSSTLPDLREIEGIHCIRELGKSLNITDYEFNYASFWVLDVLSNKIQDLQIKNFDSKYQKKFHAWFRFVLQSIAVSDFSRAEMFDILQKIFELAVNMIKERKPIPDPKEIEICNTSKISVSRLSENPSLNSLHKSNSLKSRKRLSSNKCLLSTSSKLSRNSSIGSRKCSDEIEEPTISEDQIKQNVQYFQKMVEMLYQIFADRFVYTMVHKCFTSTVTVTPVDIEVVFQDPKQLRPIPVEEPPALATSPKRGRSLSKSRKKSKDKVKKKKTTSEDIKGNVSKSRKTSKRSIGRKEMEDKKEISKDKSKKKKNKEIKKSIEKQTEIKHSNDEKKDINLKKEFESKRNKHSKGQEKVNKLEQGKNKDIISSSPRKKGVDDSKQSKQKKSLKRTGKKYKALSVEDYMIKEKHISLDEKAKLFDHDIDKELDLELEHIRTKNQFILPLSETIDTKYVANIIKPVMPEESKPVDNIEANTMNKKVKGKNNTKKSMEKKKSVKFKKK